MTFTKKYDELFRELKKLSLTLSPPANNSAITV